MFGEMSKKELLEKSLQHTMEMVRAMKTSMCEDNKGHADLNPFCVFGVEIQDDEGNEALGGAIVEMELSKNEHPIEMLPKMLSEVHQQGMDKFLWVMFVCEGYAETDQTKIAQMMKDDSDYEYGSLENDFLNNPVSTVQEGIIATAFSWTGEMATYQQPYKYNDNGLPDFSQEIVNYFDEEPMEGRVPNIFTKFIKYCQLAELSNK